jgi:dolichyl-phosphate-mannose-protein mannosyltransferase
MEIKSKLKRFYHWEHFWLIAIVVASLACHFITLANPSELILDEQHYIHDAESISNNHVDLRLEHPPLAKLLIVAGIDTFGDNAWGWRVFPIIFSTITIILFYFLCRRLNMSRTAASIATYLLAFENMFFLMGGLAMLDVYCVTFMMAAFLLYVYKRYINSGVAIGLAALAKLNGALALPVVGLHWLFDREGGRSRFFMFTIIFCIVVFVGLMPFLDFGISHKISADLNPIQRTNQMLTMTSSLTYHHVDHPYKSNPWDWAYSWRPMPFWWMPHYTAAISFTIWALMVPTFLYLVYQSLKRNSAALFALCWFAGVYLVWIPITLITDRVNYIYYFYPVVGSLCIGLAIGLNQLLDIFRSRPRGKLKWTMLSIVIFVLFLHLVSFLILSPLIHVDFAKWVGITN